MRWLSAAPFHELVKGLEICARPTLSYFVDGPPSVAQGGKGVVVSGCPACKKRINTMTQFLDHLANDVMPALIDRLSAA
jgi:hypothetical protein